MAPERLEDDFVARLSGAPLCRTTGHSLLLWGIAHGAPSGSLRFGRLERNLPCNEAWGGFIQQPRVPRDEREAPSPPSSRPSSRTGRVRPYHPAGEGAFGGENYGGPMTWIPRHGGGGPLANHKRRYYLSSTWCVILHGVAIYPLLPFDGALSLFSRWRYMTGTGFFATKIAGDGVMASNERSWGVRSMKLPSTTGGTLLFYLLRAWCASFPPSR